LLFALALAFTFVCPLIVVCLLFVCLFVVHRFSFLFSFNFFQFVILFFKIKNYLFFCSFFAPKKNKENKTKEKDAINDEQDKISNAWLAFV
jgi:hypothetical protein